ncbi:MAG: DUF2911 domain-containing protein [Acidobacteria bacterium]|nr:DUF2911 domain-containing protein [Acidobacteriota bacterium]
MRPTLLPALTCALLLGSAAPAQAPAPAPPAPAPAAAPVRVQPSPAGTAATQVGGKWVVEKEGAEPRYREGKWVTVTYSRPILRGRTGIFGSGADYGKKVTGGAPVWRAGANATTRFKTEAPLLIGGKAVPAGEYSLFIELKEGAWTFILSSQPALKTWDPKEKSATWGADNYDPKFDLVRAPMKLGKPAASFDQLTFGFVNMTQEGGTLAVWWEKELATVDFKVAP